MPCAVSQGSPALSIALAGSSKRIFQTGDTIIGKVVRRQHIVAPECQVTLRLLGRAKTKIVVTRSNGNGGTRHDTYRSRYHFFGPETGQIIFAGPLHVATEEAAPAEFPFVITIPAHPSENLSREAGRNSFLPTDPASIAAQPLPPSYASYHHHREAYVEYWLEAQLNPGPGTHNKSVSPALSTQPIILGAPPTLEPVAKMVKTSPSPAHSITSYRLIPGMDEVELSFKQKSKQFFHTSSVPSLSYSIHVGIPVVMQLQSRDTIPLTLRLSPMARGTSDDVQKTTQKATIDYITLQLKTNTVIRAGEHFLGGSRETSTSDAQDLHLEKALKALPTPMVVDIDPDGEAINLGALFDLHLCESGLFSGNERLSSQWFAPPITPSFVTYNMTVSHALKVTVSVTVCGKGHSDTFKLDTRIMSPPIMNRIPQNRPKQAIQLEAGPAPPSFAEAMWETAGGEAERPPNYNQEPKAVSEAMRDVESKVAMTPK
ncbi:hypothetical protein ISF_08552 [Cordyceps fumosorosea ARSEF 2679]|uniref:Arrestin n=1 Tax=Cordyceps fumosorosea (strain ARSEF 2679) TaxID=1081104 RepID=A0A162MBK1_CORFA|nr:hypothetical protein ISF_08552 [Cordyceps fumosorosea ARSEF 2679]OAA53850.1 hypothetical protein ISF_08552 [Cordyceps fumosorosea ARSEF 2679]